MTRTRPSSRARRSQPTWSQASSQPRKSLPSNFVIDVAGPEAGWQLTVDGRPEEPDAVAAAVTGGGGSGGGDGGGVMVLVMLLLLPVMLVAMLWVLVLVLPPLVLLVLLVLLVPVLMLVLVLVLVLVLPPPPPLLLLLLPRLLLLLMPLLLLLLLLQLLLLVLLPPLLLRLVTLPLPLLPSLPLPLLPLSEGARCLERRRRAAGFWGRPLPVSFVCASRLGRGDGPRARGGGLAQMTVYVGFQCVRFERPAVYMETESLSYYAPLLSALLPSISMGSMVYRFLFIRSCERPTAVDSRRENRLSTHRLSPLPAVYTAGKRVIACVWDEGGRPGFSTVAVGVNWPRLT